MKSISSKSIIILTSIVRHTNSVKLLTLCCPCKISKLIRVWKPLEVRLTSKVLVIPKLEIPIYSKANIGQHSSIVIQLQWVLRPDYVLNKRKVKIIPRQYEVSQINDLICGKIVNGACSINIKPAIRISEFVISFDQESILKIVIIYDPLIRVRVPSYKNKSIIVNMKVSSINISEINSLNS